MDGENPTLAYYHRNAEEFVSGTVGVDMRDARPASAPLFRKAP